MNARIWWMTAMFALGLCSLAIAQEAAGAAAGEELSPHALAWVWSALWQGTLIGVGVGFMGFFGKSNGVRFEGRRLAPAAFAGAVAGLLVGIVGISFDGAAGWLSTVGAMVLIERTVKCLWRRWAGDLVGEAVARTVSRHLPSPSEGPLKP